MIQVFPNSPLYPKARRDFNLAFNKFPCVIVYCQNVQDVVNTLLWAKKKKIPLRVRSGGHSFEAFSIVNDGVILDVSNLNTINLDKTRGLASIGAGNKLLPLYNALWENGVTIPGGTCPSVGIAGLTLGGGFGMLTRKLGMLCDSLVGVEMVDANGRIISANNLRNSDLLWASCGGGGGNFGIITSFVFKVHPISNVSIYNITWNWKDSEKVINTWQNWAPFVDEKLTSIVRLFSKEEGRIISSGEFLGPKKELHKLLIPLLNTGEPIKIDILTVPYIEAVRTFGGISVPSKFKHTGAYVYKNLSPEAIKTMLHFLAHSPNLNSSVEFQALGGAVKNIKPNETAYFHRRANFNLHYKTQWTDDKEEKRNTKWVEELRKAMLNYTVGDYVNFPDKCIKDWPVEYYGTNFNKLRKVKSKYDPDDFFSFAQSIPPL